MAPKRLNGKIIAAGVLLLLNAILWFVQIGLDYAIADQGFWGVGGLIQNYTVVLAELPNALFLLAEIVASILLLTRKRCCAVAAMLVLAAYFAFLLVPELSGGVPEWIDLACRVLGLVFAAIALACAGSDAAGVQTVAFLAIVGTVAWWCLSTFFNVTGGVYAAMALPVAAVYVVRGLMYLAAIICAVLAQPVKVYQPKH